MSDGRDTSAGVYRNLGRRTRDRKNPFEQKRHAGAGVIRPPLSVSRVLVRSVSKSHVLELPQPDRQLVPTRAGLVHHPFISILDRPQVAEGRRGYGGSNKAVSIERDSLRKD